MRHDWRPDTARPEELTFSVVTTMSKRRLGFFQAAADGGQASVPEIAEIDCWLLPGETILIEPYRLNEARGQRGLSVYPTKSTDPTRKFDEPEEGLALVISWVEFGGPIVEQWPPAGHTRLFGDLPLIGAAAVPQATKLPPRIRTPVRVGRPHQMSIRWIHAKDSDSVSRSGDGAASRRCPAAGPPGQRVGAAGR